MGKWSGIVGFAREVALETLWPTRCALCDVPGAVLCESCAASLPVLDWWSACPRCGSSFGRVQCDLCNPVSLARIGREKLPFSGCASATVFDEGTTGRLVSMYKDYGERRLSGVLAERMARVVAPDWEVDAVTFVPATFAAVRHRGFDHAELLAGEIATRLDAPLLSLLGRPSTRDQRALSGGERIANLGGSFTAIDERAAGQSLLLVDDVFTTGATICAATDALIASGAKRVCCLTFARV